MIDLDQALIFAQNLAAQSNTISDKYFKSSLKVETKSDKSPVTEADKKINGMVISEIKKKFPTHGLLGEEESWNLGAEYTWVCDPIDGTIAFTIGDPVFMFSIALVNAGMPVLAVVRELAAHKSYWALKGEGAYSDSGKIRVSNRALKDSWLVFPTELKRLLKYRKVYSYLDERAYQTSCVHSAVFKGMLIAQGLADGNVLPNGEKGYPWDFAAVKLIVEEAGGKVTDSNGNEQRWDQPLKGVIISNGIIHQDLIKAAKLGEVI